MPLKLFYKNDKLYIISELEEDQIENIYSQKLYDIDSLKNNIDYEENLQEEFYDVSEGVINFVKFIIKREKGE